MAEHRAGPRVLLEDEVQVGAADAAVRHLHEHVERPQPGNWQLLHLDRTFAHVYGRADQLLGHPLSFADRAEAVSSRVLES